MPGIPDHLVAFTRARPGCGFTLLMQCGATLYVKTQQNPSRDSCWIVNTDQSDVAVAK